MAITTEINLLRYRRTKIVATIGPASSDAATLRELISAGVNVFRLNMSHGEHPAHRHAYQNIRNAAKALDRTVGVLADLCGPKIRTGRFTSGQINLTKGESVTITTRKVTGEPGLIPSQYAALADDVKPGNRILLADGLLELTVDSIDGQDVNCTVVHGGVLGDNKGINLPGVDVSAPSMTEKDMTDAGFALSLGVDFIALSFVRGAADLEPLKQLIAEQPLDVRVISKIEKPEALENAEAIVAASDGIMVARGDLGVELPPEQVPVAQRELVNLARQQGKPVIVATQMLESMINHSRPTRAEVTDVSHAVEMGADAVMLSGETAVGSYPVETVQTMHRIARQTESHFWGGVRQEQPIRPERFPLPVWNVIANATAQISRELRTSAVLVVTRGGTSAVTVSAARPAASIVAITSLERASQRMALYWGVIPLVEPETGKTNPNELARRVADRLGLAEANESIVLVRGFHEDPHLNTPSVTVISLGD